MDTERKLYDCIKTNGIYQSTTKLTGEMHAACFMYGTYWNYIRFLQKEKNCLQVFNSEYDLNHIEKIKAKVNTPEFNLISNSKYLNFIEEGWGGATFSFDKGDYNNIPKHFDGNIRKDYISEEDELILIGSDNFSDIYKFIEIKPNLGLEFEILNLFTTNEYINVNNGLSNFGQTDLEGIFAFQKLEQLKYIQPSKIHYLDSCDYCITEKGSEYFDELKNYR